MQPIDSVWRQAAAQAEPGLALRPFGTRGVVVADDAWPSLATTLTDAVASEVVLVTDTVPKLRAGADLLSSVLPVLPSNTRVVELPDAVHASVDEARSLSARLAGADVVVALGSGTVTDLAKRARDDGAPQALLISLPTAASVTAYTSALTVLLVDGVKRTLPARAPDLVICDLATLSAAPLVMTRAGFGDVLARSVSYGDWWLAGQLGLDDGFSRVPGVVMGDAEQHMIELAADVARGTSAGVAAVTEGVLRAGLAMSVVNQTAPLSGWEHVISHWLDMTAASWARQPALHGEQVGVATLLSARAYERLWPTLDPSRLEGPLPKALVESWRDAIERRYGAIDPSGGMAAEAWRDVSRKLAAWDQAQPRRQAFWARWRDGSAITDLAALVRPAADVEAALVTAGAPTRFGQLSQPVPREAAVEALTHAHLVRARLTLGDLLALGGVLDEAAAAALLD